MCLRRCPDHSRRPVGCSSDNGSNQTSSSTTSTTTAGAETLTAQLKTADGKPVADATFDWSDGYATVTVETVSGGILAPGFHGLHIHSVGKCEADSVAPSGERRATSTPRADTCRCPGIPAIRPAVT